MTGATERLAGVELGGTKSIAVLWDGARIVERFRTPTEQRGHTLKMLRAKLDEWNAEAELDGLGIASFGPVRLDPTAADFGRILSTPKVGWPGAQVASALHDGMHCPMEIDTDVNAAALAEYVWGAGQGCSSLVYLTIGTGIGGGILIDGRSIKGRLHPEIGHIMLRRASEDPFGGACAFHGDCIEGLISGPALARRFGKPSEDGLDDAQLDLVSHDLAQLLATLIHSFAPQKILVGGGVGLGVPDLLRRAIGKVEGILGAYYDGLRGAELETLIAAPGLGEDAGPMGAIALAQMAAQRRRLSPPPTGAQRPS